MMRYGDDVPPRAQRVEDYHARQVLAEHAILDEFRAVFNIASFFAEVIYKLDPNHPAVEIAEKEGMLGRFLNEVHIKEQPPSVSELHESGVLEIFERPVVPGGDHEGSGALPHGAPVGARDSLPQGGGTDDEGRASSGDNPSGSDGGGQVPSPDGSGEDVASGSVPSVE